MAVQIYTLGQDIKYFYMGNKQEKGSVELGEAARFEFSYNTKKMWNSMTLPELDSFYLFSD